MAAQVSKIRAGVIGAGIGKFHIDGFQNHPEAECVALCDISTEADHGVAGDCGVVDVHTDCNEIPEPAGRGSMDARAHCGWCGAGGGDGGHTHGDACLGGDSRLLDVLIAYNHRDVRAARALVEELRRRGLLVWIDREQVPPGRWFLDEIQEGIAIVRTAAVLLGPGGLGGMQTLELRAVMTECVDAGKPVIPVLLPGVEDIPQKLRFLRQLNYVHFRECVDEVEGVDRLVWGVTGSRPPHWASA